jgi:hypothetical protein
MIKAASNLHFCLMENKRDLNAKILNITMLIKDHYPELTKYIEEMHITIPNENSPRVDQEDLTAYYDSLKSVLTAYQSKSGRDKMSE